MPYRRPYNAVVRYAITLNDHHITPQIQLHQICGPVNVRSLTHRQGG